MTTQIDLSRPPVQATRPPRYTWVPVFALVGLPLLFAAAFALGRWA